MKSSPKLWTKAGICFREGLGAFLLLLVGIYRTVGTNHLGGACRFEPSCSAYAAEALRRHTPFRASKLIVIRLSKCRPGGPYGFDPVPDTDQEKHK